MKWRGEREGGEEEGERELEVCERGKEGDREKGKK